jgi:hypothetical protein
MSLEPGIAPRGAVAAPDSVPVGRIEALTFLGDSFALALTVGLPSPSGALRGWLLDGERRTRLTVSPIAVAQDGETAILLLGSGRRPLRAPVTERILIETHTGVGIALASVAQANVAPEEFGERLRAAFDAPARAQLLERTIARVARSGATLADAAGPLAALHHATRERLPGPSGDPASTCAANVDGLWRVDGTSYYVEGWAFDRGSELRSLRLLSPEGRRVELLPQAHRYPRPDVCSHFGVPATERLGFIAFVELPEESPGLGGWVLQCERHTGEALEVTAPAVADDPLQLRTTVLGDVELDGGDGALLRTHVEPALTRLGRRLSQGVEIETIDQYGTPPRTPTCRSSCRSTAARSSWSISWRSSCTTRRSIAPT